MRVSPARSIAVLLALVLTGCGTAAPTAAPPACDPGPAARSTVPQPARRALRSAGGTARRTALRRRTPAGVLVARALAQDPDLLLDEPTAFLDAQSRVSVTGMLRRLARERGMVVVASTHDVEIALRVAG